MKILILGWFFCIAIVSAAKAATEKVNASVIPVGWKVPIVKKLKVKWRDSSPNKFTSFNADINGDGIDDVTRILIKNDGKTFGLFVWLSGGKNAPISLIEGEDIANLDVMGIRFVKPGKYTTVCGKGYVDCERGKNEEVDLKYFAIDYFKNESANSFFIWDPARKAFIREWISD